MQQAEARRILLDPLVNNNPVALQILGICPALAVTTSLATASIMAQIWLKPYLLALVASMPSSMESMGAKKQSGPKISWF